MIQSLAGETETGRHILRFEVRQFFEYLLGVRVTLAYRWVYCLLIPLGATISVETVWAWGDLMNGLQVFPNLVGLIGLSGIVAAAARAPLKTPNG